ncbi:hypothetical protein CEUSTIGMA_g9953.t1 [Chlamydomonas eustigma]|uniref:Uncharacterized protein n=1 Tax=Chlamydomonas eustigma TaxID=1157962 RepID=A0A250XHP7_9CHLO|nr:hypothetical protein CEUSTIGMA_g9953.t1 [Chlamydomonas eustigma]|eukprot:GAX82526.1 hypothetical protein CEUSTIGMA_g9953.t1 [Chlamydomonas eustigma]
MGHTLVNSLKNSASLACKSLVGGSKRTCTTTAPRQNPQTQLSALAPSSETEYETVYETETAETNENPCSNNKRVPEAVISIQEVPEQLSPTSLLFLGASNEQETNTAELKSVAVSSSNASDHVPGFWSSHVGGWVVAIAFLIAIRFSREQADSERMDVSVLQLKQQESRVQSAELREKRRLFLESERKAKEEEATKKLAQARVQAEEAEKERIAREAAYRAEASKETARLWAQQEAARKAFEEQNSLMGEELERRTALELKLREEAEKKRAEEREKAKVEAAERSRLAAERAKALMEEERLQKEKEAAARSLQMEELRKIQTAFNLKLKGTVAVQAAPYNTLTTYNRVKQLARIQLDLKLTLDASSPLIESQSSDKYESIQSAVDDCEHLSAKVVAPIIAKVVLAMKSGTQISDPADVPPSDLMDLHEINYWSRISLAFCQSRCQLIICQVAPLAGSSRLEENFKVECQRCVLPLGHPMRMDSRLITATGFIASMQLQEAVAIIDRVIEDEEDSLGISHPSLNRARNKSQAGSTDPFGFEPILGFSTSPSSQRLPPLLVPALVYAQLVDRAAGAAGAPAPAEVASLSSDQAPASTSMPVAQTPAAAAADTLSERAENEAVGQSAAGASSSKAESQDQQAGSEIALTSSGSQHQLDPSCISNSSDGNKVEEAAFILAASSSDSQTKIMEVQTVLPASQSIMICNTEDRAATSASPAHTSIIALARYQLEQRVKKLPQDAVIPTARLLISALGSRHPVARIMLDLAERTTSIETRQATERKLIMEEQAVLSQQERELQFREGGPATDVIDPNSAAVRRSLSPVPERLWAMRNVANGMVRAGNAVQLGEAVGMLQQADVVARQHYGQYHPARLATLLDVHEALSASLMMVAPGALEAVEGTKKLLDVSEDIVSTALALVERYGSQKDTLSVALLCEAVVQEFNTLLPEDHPELPRMKQIGEEAASLLSPLEKRVVMSKRVSGGFSFLRSVAKEFTEELGAYTLSKRSSKVEQWNKGQNLSPLTR